MLDLLELSLTQRFRLRCSCVGPLLMLAAGKDPKVERYFLTLALLTFPILKWRTQQILYAGDMRSPAVLILTDGDA
jgi:hypothetical protein